MPDLTDLKRKTAELLDEGRRTGALSVVEHRKRSLDLDLAKTLEDVEALVSDLMEAPEGPSAAMELSAPHKAQMTVMGQRTLTAYDLGGKTELLTVMGSTVIDLSGLDPATEMRIELLVVMGDTTIEVPAGLQIQVDGLPIMGDCHIDPAVRAGKAPIRVNAVAIMGSFRVVRKKNSLVRATGSH